MAHSYVSLRSTYTSYNTLFICIQFIIKSEELYNQYVDFHQQDNL